MHQYISFRGKERSSVSPLSQDISFLVFDVHRRWMVCSPPLLEIQTLCVKGKNSPQEEKEQDPFQTFFNVPSELYMSYDVSE